MVRFFICFLFAGVFAAAAWSQNATPPVENVGIVYNRETTFNLKLTTNRGFVPGLEFGRLRTYYKTTYYHISLGEIKHPKEQRQSAEPVQSRSFRPYVYGKQNNLFALRGGWGVKRYFSEKAKQKGVAVGMSYTFGPSLGLLKPYYLTINLEGANAGIGRPTAVKYSEKYKADFLNNSKILGAAPFTQGLGEISVIPGGTASIAYHMDWGAFDEMVKALDIGLVVDVFARKAPIFVGDEQNKQVFFNFFLNLQFGKRK